MNQQAAERKVLPESEISETPVNIQLTRTCNTTQYPPWDTEHNQHKTSNLMEHISMTQNIRRKQKQEQDETVTEMS